MAQDIYIDESAANADISKIRAAITKLGDSQNSIKRLQSGAADMQGMTGSAITEKCAELDAKITALTEDLNYTITLIQRAVQEYKQKDAALVSAIQKGGV